MKTHEIEEWALRAIERAENGQPNEDSRVELKADWPDAQRAARRIAGHANALRGEPILWIIGVDEDQGLKGANQNDLATWWPQTQAEFDGPLPRLRDVLVYRKGKTAVALCFESEQIPYVVRNPSYGKPDGGPVRHEVPWREGTAVRSATHSDLVLLLSPLQRPVLRIEVGRNRGFVNRYSLTQPERRAIVDLPTAGRSMHSHPLPTVAYYLRVKVVNCGRRTARSCTGYLANMEVWRDRVFCETKYADYMRLVWSHSPGIPRIDLLPEVPHWLDLVSTLEYDQRFFIETDPKAPQYAGGFDDSSVFRLTVRVFAEDAEPAESLVYLQWKRQWDCLDVFDDAEWESRKGSL